MEEQTFIIAYCSDWLIIEPSTMVEFSGNNSLYHQYQEGLANKMRTDKNNCIYDGDVISYNNRFWCSVKATDVKEAFRKATDKFNAYFDSMRSAT